MGWDSSTSGKYDDYEDKDKRITELEQEVERLREALEQLVKTAVPIMKRRTDGVEVKTGYSKVPSALIAKAEQALGKE